MINASLRSRSNTPSRSIELQADAVSSQQSSAAGDISSFGTYIESLSIGGVAPLRSSDEEVAQQQATTTMFAASSSLSLPPHATEIFSGLRRCAPDNSDSASVFSFSACAAAETSSLCENAAESVETGGAFNALEVGTSSVLVQQECVGAVLPLGPSQVVSLVDVVPATSEVLVVGAGGEAEMHSLSTDSSPSPSPLSSEAFFDATLLASSPTLTAAYHRCVPANPNAFARMSPFVDMADPSQLDAAVLSSRSQTSGATHASNSDTQSHHSERVSPPSSLRSSPPSEDEWIAVSIDELPPSQPSAKTTPLSKKNKTRNDHARGVPALCHIDISQEIAVSSHLSQTKAGRPSQGHQGHAIKMLVDLADARSRNPEEVFVEQKGLCAGCRAPLRKKTLFSKWRLCKFTNMLYCKSCQPGGRVPPSSFFLFFLFVLLIFPLFSLSLRRPSRDTGQTIAQDELQDVFCVSPCRLLSGRSLRSPIALYIGNQLGSLSQKQAPEGSAVCPCPTSSREGIFDNVPSA